MAISPPSRKVKRWFEAWTKDANPRCVLHKTANGTFDEAAIEVRAEQVMVRAESMQLKQTAMNLSRGKTAAIEAEVLPETASEKGVRYAIVSGPEIVTLHHDGTVTGKAVGTAKISVTSLDNPELVPGDLSGFL